jgi:Mg2+ and Co2+ transporter CorA
MPGGTDVQFWWVFGMMLTTSLSMLWLFRRVRWL